MNITPVKPLAESDKISFALERKVQTNNTLKMTHHDGVKLPWVHMNGEETKTYSDVSSSFQDRCSEMVCVRRYEAHNDFQKLDFQNEKASTNLGKLISKLLQKDDSPFSEANVILKINNVEDFLTDRRALSDNPGVKEGFYLLTFRIRTLLRK